MFTNLVYNPSVNRYKIFYFYHVSLSILLKLTAGVGTGRRKPWKLLCYTESIGKPVCSSLSGDPQSDRCATSVWWQEPPYLYFNMMAGAQEKTL